MTCSVLRLPGSFYKLHPNSLLELAMVWLQEVAEHQRSLEALPSQRECRQEEERLTAEIEGLEKACQYREVDMKATLEKQGKIDDEVSPLMHTVPAVAVSPVLKLSVVHSQCCTAHFE